VEIDTLALVALLAGFAFSLVEAVFAVWLTFRGLPKSRQAIDERFDAEKAELMLLLESKEAQYKQEITEFAESIPEHLQGVLSQPETLAAISAALEPAIAKLAPDLIDALVSDGAKILEKRGEMSKSMAKVAAESGIDIEGMLAKLDPATIQQGLAALQGGGAPTGGVANLQGLLGNALGDQLLKLIPAKYRRLIPPGVNPLQLLGGLGGAPMGGGNGSSSFRPGLPGRD